MEILLFGLTAGKEYQWKKNRSFGLNIKATYSGGFRNTPIDIARSTQLGQTEYFESLAFSERQSNYFRTDLRVSVKRNRSKSTSTLSLDIMNATNHQNQGGQYFDAQSGEIKKWYQMPLIPVLNYRIEF